MEYQLIVGVLAGLAIGGLVTWLVVSARFREQMGKQLAAKQEELSATRAELRYERDRATGLMGDVQNLNGDLRKERQKHLSVSMEYSRLKSKYENMQEKLTDHRRELKELQQQFAANFRNLANEIFEEKSKRFTDQNKHNLHELLKPLGERITHFEQKVEQTNKESIERNAALREQINSLKSLNQRITQEAENLTRALKVDNKLQGSWGEIQLESILQGAGLERDIHYDKERTFKNEDADRQRPDYIVRLPEDKYIIIDSKVSLLAYTKHLEAKDEADQQQYLQEHINSIRQHVKSLSDKQYQHLSEITQPDYVLMFLANEAALVAALRADHELYDYALERQIVIVTTTTLMATLKTVSFIWKHDLQRKNARDIARQAGALYDKFVLFSDDLLKVGTQLTQAQNTYQSAMKKLSEGRDNLVRKTERLKTLGAKTNKQIDPGLLDQSDVEE